jgi:osmotically-inducible protein OsmY
MNPQITNDASLPTDRAPASLDGRLLDGNVLRELILAKLHSDPNTAVLAIEVEVWDGVVHLRGVVHGPDQKSAAERVATWAASGALVANDLAEELL